MFALTRDGSIYEIPAAGGANRFVGASTYLNSRGGSMIPVGMTYDPDVGKLVVTAQQAYSFDAFDVDPSTGAASRFHEVNNFFDPLEVTDLVYLDGGSYLSGPKNVNGHFNYFVIFNRVDSGYTTPPWPLGVWPSGYARRSDQQVVYSSGRQLWALDFSTGLSSVLGTVSALDSAITGLASNPSGTTLYASTSGNMLWELDAYTLSAKFVGSLPDNTMDIAFVVPAPGVSSALAIGIAACAGRRRVRWGST